MIQPYSQMANLLLFNLTVKEWAKFISIGIDFNVFVFYCNLNFLFQPGTDRRTAGSRAPGPTIGARTSCHTGPKRGARHQGRGSHPADVSRRIVAGSQTGNESSGRLPATAFLRLRGGGRVPRLRAPTALPREAELIKVISLLWTIL